MEGRIHVISLEQWLEKVERKREWNREHSGALDRPDGLVEWGTFPLQKREELLVTYPFSVILEGNYHEHDLAVKWCWQNIGPKQGECDEMNSYYPGCPWVIATARLVSGTYKDKNGVEVSWEETAYDTDFPEHSHFGNWLTEWLGKTGYDYGASEYFFKDETSRDRLIAAVPTLIL